MVFGKYSVLSSPIPMIRTNILLDSLSKTHSSFKRILVTDFASKLDLVTFQPITLSICLVSNIGKVSSLPDVNCCTSAIASGVVNRSSEKDVTSPDWTDFMSIFTKIWLPLSSTPSYIKILFIFSLRSSSLQTFSA